MQLHTTNDRSTIAAGTSETFLHDLPEKEVYSLLIDSYRLRVEDDYKFAGDPHGLYAQEDPVEEFEEFLALAEKNGKLLPKWWGKEKREKCVKLGEGKGWSSLGKAVEKGDVQGHYMDGLMPMKLRVLAERVYGEPIEGMPAWKG